MELAWIGTSGCIPKKDVGFVGGNGNDDFGMKCIRLLVHGLVALWKALL